MGQLLQNFGEAFLKARNRNSLTYSPIKFSYCLWLCANIFGKTEVWNGGRTVLTHLLLFYNNVTIKNTFVL